MTDKDKLALSLESFKMIYRLCSVAEKNIPMLEQIFETIKEGCSINIEGITGRKVEDFIPLSKKGEVG